MNKTKTTDSPTSLAKIEQAAATSTTPVKPKKPAAEVKPSAARPAPKAAKKVVEKPVPVTNTLSMQEQVGLTAGSIWRHLDKNGATAVAKLIRELPEDEKIIQRSIGWLAQEDKITLTVIDRAETIALKA
ncbi:MAG: winged helix-turn-helix domain-containing protein [Methylococcales bacterium]